MSHSQIVHGTFKLSSSLFPGDMVQYPCKQEIPPFLLDLLSLFSFQFKTPMPAAQCVSPPAADMKPADPQGTVGFFFNMSGDQIYPIYQKNTISMQPLGFLRPILVLNLKMGFMHIDILADWNKIYMYDHMFFGVSHKYVKHFHIPKDREGNDYGR